MVSKLEDKRERIPCTCGGTFWQRQRVGPTGHNHWSILVDKCRCGRNMPVHPEQLTNKQDKWVIRWNNRITKDECEIEELKEKYGVNYGQIPINTTDTR